VTKSGTNSWHGEFGTQFVTSKLNAGSRPSFYEYRGEETTSFENVPYIYPYRNAKDAYNSFFPTANLSGAIIKDRAWFFASYSPQMFDTRRTVNFFNPEVTGSTLTLTPSTPIAGFEYLQPTEEYQARTKYEYALTRIDAQISNSLRFTGSYLWNPEIIDGTFPCGSTCIGTGRAHAFANGRFFNGAEAYALTGGRVNSNN